MIATAKAIPHGHANLAYNMGESKSKKHAGEKIQFVAAHGLDAFHRSAEAWEEIKRACRNHPEIKNTVIRIILSPDKKATENFTLDDWEDLWQEFAELFDTLDHRDAKGRLISKPTNLRGSIHNVYVHFDSKGGVPHLHAAVCRVDGNNHTNPDNNIHLRAHAVADIISLRRGWKEPKKVRADQLRNLKVDCLNILRQMPSFSLADFHARLRLLGYEVLTQTDKSGTIRGHSIMKDNCHYKMSEIGREFTVSRLPDTWRRLHEEKASQHKPKAAPISPQADYFTFAPDRVPYRLETIPGQPHCFLPEKVMDLLNNEFDWLELSNAHEMVSTAVSLFIGLILPAATSASSGGGGGSASDLPWGRDPREDELAWARRCAQMARQLFKPQPRTRGRR